MYTKNIQLGIEIIWHIIYRIIGKTLFWFDGPYLTAILYPSTKPPSDILLFCLHSWPHKWTKNSRNNSPPEKSWKSFHRPENGNVWIMLLGLFRDSSRYTLRKFTILYLIDHFCTLETMAIR